jgi:hypothetical protein
LEQVIISLVGLVEHGLGLVGYGGLAIGNVHQKAFFDGR